MRIFAGVGAFEPLVLKYIFDGMGKPNALHYVVWGVGLMLVLGVFKESTSTLSNWLTRRTRLKLHYHLLDITVERIHHQTRGLLAV